MADVSAHTPSFSRGSTVLDYWLAHAEGLTIQPLGARVEEVVVVAPVPRRVPRRALSPDAPPQDDPGRRDRLRHALHRRPAARRGGAAGAAASVPRPSPERIAAARAHAAGSVQRTQAGTRSAAAWLRPRATHAGETSCAVRAAGCSPGRQLGLAWLTPRIAGFARLTLEPAAYSSSAGTVHATRRSSARTTPASRAGGRRSRRVVNATAHAGRLIPAMLLKPDSHEAPAEEPWNEGAQA